MFRPYMVMPFCISFGRLPREIQQDISQGRCSCNPCQLPIPPPPLFLRVFFVIFPLQKENQELFLLMAGERELPDAPTYWNIGSER